MLSVWRQISFIVSHIKLPRWKKIFSEIRWVNEVSLQVILINVDMVTYMMLLVEHCSHCKLNIIEKSALPTLTVFSGIIYEWFSTNDPCLCWSYQGNGNYWLFFVFFSDNLGIGSYVFPFRFQLLNDLPGRDFKYIILVC